MRLGLGSYTYTWAIGVPGRPPAQPLTAPDLVRRAAAAGVGCVQIADNLPLDALGDGERRDLRTLAVEMAVAIEVGARGLTAERLERFLDLAVFFHSPILRFVIDGPGYQPTVDSVVAVVREALPRLRASGVRLAIENHDRFPTRTLVEVVERLGARHVGICLDTVNSFAALEGPEVVVERLAPYALNLHVKDFTITRVNGQMGFAVEGAPAGQGRLAVPWLLRQLEAAGRDVNAILELWTPRASSVEETFEREAEWARASVAYLRRLIPD